MYNKVLNRLCHENLQFLIIQSSHRSASSCHYRKVAQLKHGLTGSFFFTSMNYHQCKIITRGKQQFTGFDVAAQGLKYKLPFKKSRGKLTMDICFCNPKVQIILL